MFKLITNPTDPIVDFIQNMRDMDDAVIVDSAKLISKFILSQRFRPITLYLKKSLVDRYDFQNHFNEIILIDDKLFHDIAGYKFSKGVLATFEKPQFAPLENLQPPFIIINGLTSPENVGSIVRTMAGLGFKSLLIDSKTCSPYLRRCIRVSMGNINFINVHRIDDLKTFIKNSELNIYYAANDERAVSIYKTRPGLNSAFVIGSEGHGIDKEILNDAKNIIKIPVTEGVLHYNASIACAIIASEFSRQLSLVE